MIELTDNQLMEEIKRRIEEGSTSQNELQNLNTELLEVNKKLTDSESLKSHFLSNISNEIVNPFTGIIGLAKSISEMNESQLPQIKQMASLIFTEAFHLDFQLKNIFTAAAIEAGQVHPQYCLTNLNELINNLINTYSFDRGNKEFIIDFQSCKNESECITDPEKLELILANLINNAILFSSAEKNISIQICLDDQLELSVTDQGIGIKTEDLSIIFNRFNRLENTINSINRGNGIGLSISKELTEILGGTIEVESEVGKGSKFKVLLPLPVEGSENINEYSGSGNITLF